MTAACACTHYCITLLLALVLKVTAGLREAGLESSNQILGVLT